MIHFCRKKESVLYKIMNHYTFTIDLMYKYRYFKQIWKPITTL
ncbi:hypothetical protein TREPR_2892 [Treponema primitia ZAS-2]|uniref:Uncharacterized protein n=1 Tax=Treponema primitia (strain ATCC BAA-887 / DSM 12427 / ZAS-2) TaxID=545694 RepID=F5YPA2_TREPZ|nr:hypothetical protein TREPR_2892 [Treponema primitia ZAS-2]